MVGSHRNEVLWGNWGVVAVLTRKRVFLLAWPRRGQVISQAERIGAPRTGVP